MHYVFDFDSTLYSTHRLWNAWVDMLLDHNAHEPDILPTGQSLFESGFSLHGHAKLLGFSDEKRENVVDQFDTWTKAAGDELVFYDVVPFFDSLKEEHRLTLLTYGDAGYQLPKIRASGLHRYFEDMRVATQQKHKPVHLQELLELYGEPIVFVDNSDKELERVYRAGLAIELVRMLRPSEVNQQHPFDGQKWHSINGLSELSTASSQKS